MMETAIHSNFNIQPASRLRKAFAIVEATEQQKAKLAPPLGAQPQPERYDLRSMSPNSYVENLKFWGDWPGEDLYPIYSGARGEYFHPRTLLAVKGMQALKGDLSINLNSQVSTSAKGEEAKQTTIQ